MATIAKAEDSCSSDVESEDSNYCSSSDNHESSIPIEKQTGLMCSVQDLLANMSCLDENLRDETYNDGQTTVLEIPKTNVNDEIFRDIRGGSGSSCESGMGSVTTDGGLINLQDVVVDCSKNVRSANVLQPSLYSREYVEYGYSVGRTSITNGNTCSDGNYENYPLRNSNGPVKPSYFSLHRNIPSNTNVLSPSSLERSVTREFDERLHGLHEADATQNVSSLDNSPSTSLCDSPLPNEDYDIHSRGAKRLDSESYLNRASDCFNILPSSTNLRMGESESHLMEVTDRDLNMIGLPQVSPSSLSMSQNNTLTTDRKTTTEEAQVSFHRPAMSNVEYGIIKKLPSIRRKSSTSIKTINYENIYESCAVSYRNEKSSDSDCLGKLKSADKFKTDGSILKNVKQSSPPLPLPPRTYILRYPYNYLPRNLLKPNISSNELSFSSNHDYENLPPINVNRAMLGVRHWKTYLDIEDRMHDFSTFKEKSKIDSTTMSSLNTDYSILKNISRTKRMSIVEDGDSVLSRSLPDLTNLVLEACIEVPAEDVENVNHDDSEKLPDNSRLLSVLSSLRMNKFMRSNSVDDLSNYETIWVGGIADPEELPYPRRSEDSSNGCDGQLSEHSSLIRTIEDIKTKGSLCNLYYSTMSDLSRQFYSETLRRNISDGSLPSQRSLSEHSRCKNSTSNPLYKKLEGITECNEQLLNEQKLRNEIRSAYEAESKKSIIEEDRNENIAENIHSNKEKYSNSHLQTPTKMNDVNGLINKRKFSALRNRLDGPLWAPLKSPIKFRSPAKAIQAGIKVFTRPRVHIITPDSDVDENIGIKLTSPFKSKYNLKKTSPAVIEDMTQSVEIRIRQKNENGTEQITVKRTPMKPLRSTVVSTLKNIQKTPKTSTPDNARHKISLETSENNRSESMSKAPKHSTPEAIDRNLPQISHISGLSSVMESPELSRISSSCGATKQFTTSVRRVPLSENIRPDRASRLPSMSAIREYENNHLDPTSARLNTVSKNIYSSILNAQNRNFDGFQPPRMRSEVYETLKTAEKYKENVFIAPQSIPYNISSHRSTLSPNSKIFQRKL